MKQSPSARPEGAEMCSLEAHSPAQSDPAPPEIQEPDCATSEAVKCEVLVTHSPDTLPLEGTKAQEETGTGTNFELAPKPESLPN